MGSAEEQAWLLRVDTMLSVVQRWASRTRLAPLTPAPGSGLARDDTMYPNMRPSQLAYGGIVTATEHLDLFRIAFQASRALYPSAYFTLLRSGLMGSAQAIWILKGPRAQRLENALRLERDDIKQRTGLLAEDFPGDNPTLRQGIEEERRRLDNRLREVEATAAQLGLDPTKVHRWKLNMTEVIKDASNSVHEDRHGHEKAMVRYGTNLLWRLQSGHAHGTPSARLLQINLDQVQRRPDGTLFGKASSTVMDIGNAVGAAYLLTAAAWRLYDLRCQPARV